VEGRDPFGGALLVGPSRGARPSACTAVNAFAG
jgi:hypothetical protein